MTPFPIWEGNFWFRVGENPSESMRALLTHLGVRVIRISSFPLEMSGATRLKIYIDPQGKDTSEIRFSLLAQQGFLNIPMTFFVGDPADTSTPPQPLFRVRILVGTLNVRSGPAATFADIGDVLEGQDLDIWEVAPSGWYRISQAESKWISGNPLYTQRLL